jgi:hypothetical protein
MAQESELVVPGTIALISIIPLLWVVSLSPVSPRWGDTGDS